MTDDDDPTTPSSPNPTRTCFSYTQGMLALGWYSSWIDAVVAGAIQPTRANEGRIFRHPWLWRDYSAHVLNKMTGHAILAAAGFAIAASALGMSADMLKSATVSLRHIAAGRPELAGEGIEDPAARVDRFVDEVAAPLNVLRDSMGDGATIIATPHKPLKTGLSQK